MQNSTCLQYEPASEQPHMTPGQNCLPQTTNQEFKSYTSNALLQWRNKPMSALNRTRVPPPSLSNPPPPHPSLLSLSPIPVLLHPPLHPAGKEKSRAPPPCAGSRPHVGCMLLFLYFPLVDPTHKGGHDTKHRNSPLHWSSPPSYLPIPPSSHHPPRPRTCRATGVPRS